MQIYTFTVRGYTFVSVVSDSELSARQTIKEYAENKLYFHAPKVLNDDEVELSEVTPITMDAVIWKEW